MIAEQSLHPRSRCLAALAAAGFLMIAYPAAQSPGAGAGEVVAIRELQLKPGVNLPEFERFVIDVYNPGWKGAVPGLRGYIAKADRGAQKDGYALIFIFDSEKTRNAIFPKEGGGASEKFAPLLEKAAALNKQLDKYIEPGTLSVYTDYVAMR